MCVPLCTSVQKGVLGSPRCRLCHRCAILFVPGTNSCCLCVRDKPEKQHDRRLMHLQGCRCCMSSLSFVQMSSPVLTGHLRTISPMTGPRKETHGPSAKKGCVAGCFSVGSGEIAVIFPPKLPLETETCGSAHMPPVASWCQRPGEVQNEPRAVQKERHPADTKAVPLEKFLAGPHHTNLVLMHGVLQHPTAPSKASSHVTTQCSSLPDGPRA